jgi:predicted RNA-binding protein with PIN domain
MHWLIDGYNVLISNDLGHEESARGWFRDRVSACFSGKEAEVTIVYDSRGSIIIQRERVNPVVSEIYVDNADQYIIDAIERSYHPRSIILVTDDRGIIQAVRYRHPGHVNTADFLSTLDSPPPADRPPEEKPEFDTPEDIARYLKIFAGE